MFRGHRLSLLVLLDGSTFEAGPRIEQQRQIEAQNKPRRPRPSRRA